MIYSIQPSAFTDQMTDDGTELTKLPYPFHVNDDGTIGRQDFWQGDPAAVIGFQAKLDVQHVDLFWSDFLTDPQRAVGMYLVTRDRAGTWSTHENAIQSVTMHDEPNAR